MTSANDCIFCQIVRGELTPGVVGFRDEWTAVFPSRHQQAGNRGHMLVVPVGHVEQIYGVEGELAGALMRTVARTALAVKQVFGAEGVSIRQNNEAAGGQDVFHVHFHVIPRFVGDGFRGLDREAVDVAVEERVEQARRVGEVMGSQGAIL